jgi:hypothetical protein
MIQKGNRQQGIPFFISKEKSLKLERIPLIEKKFQENWLQKLIHENPQILPIDEIESGFAPLISLGREISTSVGYIDNLYISPNGYLTLVETKLWRNPEAKREVVGQIIDYAKELTTWSYSKLNESIKLSQKLLNQNPKGIIELINEFEPIESEDENKIIDNIERNLKRGRILLLIAGDGIRESVEDMVEYLQRTAQLQFTLGLVELQVYKNPMNESDIIVIPNLITRTREITRAIIKIENNSTNQIVEVETDFKENPIKVNYSETLSEQDFFDLLEQKTNINYKIIANKILADFAIEGYIIDWGKATFSIKMLDPNGSGVKITIFQVSKNGDCYIGYSAQQIASLGLDKGISYDFSKETTLLFDNLKINPKFPESWDRWVDLKELEPKLNEFIRTCNKFRQTIINESKKVNG